MKFLKKISLLIIMFSLASCENVFNSSKNSFISSSSSSINKNESTNSSILDKEFMWAIGLEGLLIGICTIIAFYIGNLSDEKSCIDHVNASIKEKQSKENQ